MSERNAPPQPQLVAAKVGTSPELSLHCTACQDTSRPVLRMSAGGQLVTVCRSCGTRSYVRLEPEEVPAKSGDGCPKCNTPKGESTSCRRCGLVYARWKGFETVTTADAEAKRLWHTLWLDFHNPNLHAHFLSYCLHAGALHYAAGCYADVERNEPELASIAEVRGRQARVMAETLLAKHKPEEESSRMANGFKAFVLMMLLFGGIAWAGTLALKNRTQDAGEHGAVPTTSYDTMQPVQFQAAPVVVERYTP